MRRPILATLAVLTTAALSLAPALAASLPGQVTGGSLGLQKRWIEWAFGSGFNPLATGRCGQKVGGLFFLTVTSTPNVEVNCQIPAGTPLLATPAGAVAWQSKSAPTRKAIHADLDTLLEEQASPKGMLDGDSVGDINGLFKVAKPYRIRLSPKGLIEGFEPRNPFIRRSHILVASGGWWLRIAPLEAGQHELVLTEKEAGRLIDITYHITVG